MIKLKCRETLEQDGKFVNCPHKGLCPKAVSAEVHILTSKCFDYIDGSCNE